MWTAKPYDPFLGWTMPESGARRARGGRRAPHRGAPPPATADPVDVFFFGGSTMFGPSSARTHHPVGVRAAGRRRRHPVRVVNHGQMGYVNWQEVLQLEELVTGGSVPDLAVFYDGFNELLSQFTLGPPRPAEPRRGHRDRRRLREGVQPADESLRKALRRAWEERSAVTASPAGWGSRSPRRPEIQALGSSFGRRAADRPGAPGVKAAAIHARGVDIARRLASSLRLRSAFFWQPSMYSKRCGPARRSSPGTLGADPAVVARGRARGPRAAGARVATWATRWTACRARDVRLRAHQRGAAPAPWPRQSTSELRPRLTRLARRERR